MLIVDPKSSCDVCLIRLTYDGSAPPHTIPCGHIFCRACLHLIYPRKCPMCRELYSLENVKKLITGEKLLAENERPADSESAENDNLLQRLVFSWDLQEEQLAALLTEIDTRLQNQSENSNQPLRKVRKVFNSFQELTIQTENDQKIIRYLENSLQYHERLASSDRITADAIEQSLMTQVEELHMLAQYKLENEILRKELSIPRCTRYPSPPSSRPLSPSNMPPVRTPVGPRSNVRRCNTSAKLSNAIYPTSRNTHASPSSTPSSTTSPNPKYIPRTSSDGRKGMRRAHGSRDLRDINPSSVAVPKGSSAKAPGTLDTDTDRKTIISDTTFKIADAQASPPSYCADSVDDNDDLAWILPWVT
ncbi:hypothetical protein BDZ94DRAFT_1270695 [Collybia nuda]|uniref:RING-type domain-containing protein n=1 Tax=Collybia nuda TaxID=64659 RepID=A0A9P6CAK3_9AGAR|nr:hypothetical protein BDZ94DRAFT_1270695 [Collybia nuda]